MEDAKMRIALTFATGIPNCHVVNRLAQAGHRVRCLYDADPDYEEAPFWDRTIEWLLGSVYDPVSIAALVDDADAVVHVVSPLDQGDIEADAIVPMRVLVAAYDAGVPRFVYLSTASWLEIVLHARGGNGTGRVQAPA
jgi:uncharacterized protein YbjT (DUF2867 family)